MSWIGGHCAYECNSRCWLDLVEPFILVGLSQSGCFYPSNLGPLIKECQYLGSESMAFLLLHCWDILSLMLRMGQAFYAALKGWFYSQPWSSKYVKRPISWIMLVIEL